MDTRKGTLSSPVLPTRTAVSPWATLAVLCSSLLIINLDTTVLNVVLPTLVRDLSATSSALQWIVDAYALVFGGLVLVAGSLADRFGRKWTFLIGVLAFAAGSAWAAFSGSVGMLIAARAAMGIGAALMMTSTLSIITDVFRDTAQRQKAIANWAGTSGVGFALGPIVGGALLARFWWGSVFLINVPIALVAAILALRLVPDSKNPAARQPDLVGAFLSVVAVGSLLWAVIEAPVDGWSSWLVLGLGAGGVALLASFILWERASSHPMLNLEFFKHRGFSIAVSTVGLLMFGLIENPRCLKNSRLSMGWELARSQRMKLAKSATPPAPSPSTSQDDQPSTGASMTAQSTEPTATTDKKAPTRSG